MVKKKDEEISPEDYSCQHRLETDLAIAEKIKGKKLSKKEEDRIKKAHELLGGQLSKEGLTLIVLLENG